MRYFHVPKDQISDKQVKITGSELHHLANVLRLKDENKITVFDGVGGIYDVVLTSVSSKLAVGEIRSLKQTERSPIQIMLIQGIAKADSMDMIIQKATELGAYGIVPVACQHSVPNLNNNRAERRVNRWRQIAIESSKQSHQPFFPIIHDIAQFKDALGIFQADISLIFIAPSMESISPQSLKGVLKQNRGVRKAQIIIGPEGDFSEDEAKFALSAHAIPVSLGNSILKTETASIAGLAILRYELANS